jgi:hypothetical protein
MNSSIDTRVIVLRELGETDDQARERTVAPSHAIVVHTWGDAYRTMLAGGDMYPRVARPPAPARTYTPAEAYAAMLEGA